MQPDQPRDIRPGETLDTAALSRCLRTLLPGFEQVDELRQFPGGYSNLTYLVRAGATSYVLRRPPIGADIKTAHDMGREYRVLSLLRDVYPAAPQPLVYCEDVSWIGAPFYLMERVTGVILRPSHPPSPLPEPEFMRRLSETVVDNLALLHTLDLQATGLGALGKPEGYTARQVSGWIGRYQQAETEHIPDMNRLATWMQAHIPPEPAPAFIHNDYKYDNIVLDPDDPGRIRAVLDWEMSTTGNPLMDLGTTLAYWVEADDPDILRLFNLTWLPGNLTREAVVNRYAARTGRDVSDIVFYAAFGCFKLGVIAQQIYARYARGLTRDPRFAALIGAVWACAAQGCRTVDRGQL
ncbi:MAG: phosphotransferase family protein [Bacteroidia bacterium]|nr:phosphotransferase family protein [Bacteroidia bacterium]